MKRPVSDIAFTPAVKAAQTVRGSRTAYEKMEQRGGWQNRVTAELAEFIADRDSFYLGTVNSDGQRLTKSLEQENQRLREELSRCCVSTFDESGAFLHEH